MASDVSMIFFRSDSSAFGIDRAARLLTDRGLQVVRDADALFVRSDNGPEMSLVFNAEADVAKEAAEIGEGTPFAGELIDCDARFEIGIEDLDEVLDEINTLIEVQSMLQQATSGYLFNSWNGELSGPDNGA